jgi:hypothetical protein
MTQKYANLSPELRRSEEGSLSGVFPGVISYNKNLVRSAEYAEIPGEWVAYVNG